MEQLMALDIEPGDQDWATKSLTSLKTELVEKKMTREKAQTEVETLTHAVEELKKTTDHFATQVPSLKWKLKHLDSKIIDLLTELWAKELSLEWTTEANKDYKSQNARLTKKLESKYSLLVSPVSYALIGVLITPL